MRSKRYTIPASEAIIADYDQDPRSLVIGDVKITSRGGYLSASSFDRFSSIDVRDLLTVALYNPWINLPVNSVEPSQSEPINA